MKNTVKRAYRLADGAAIDIKVDGPRTFLNVERPILDPMATVIVVEIDGDRVIKGTL
jgi:hypothetical protein